jgi:hypothetical protein
MGTDLRPTAATCSPPSWDAMCVEFFEHGGQASIMFWRHGRDIGRQTPGKMAVATIAAKVVVARNLHRRKVYHARHRSWLNYWNAVGRWPSFRRGNHLLHIGRAIRGFIVEADTKGSSSPTMGAGFRPTAATGSPPSWYAMCVELFEHGGQAYIIPWVATLGRAEKLMMGAGPRPTTATCSSPSWYAM